MTDDQQQKSDSSSWLIYMIEAENGRIYTGITTDLPRRILQHKTLPGKKGARFFCFSPPRNLLYWEKGESRSQASKRECEIKKMKRPEKWRLIESGPGIVPC